MDFDAGIVNVGNTSRLNSLFERASAGGELTLGFLGGSITMGSVATRPEFCYAYRVYDWFVRTFPKTKFNFVNAGIGGTSSQFGAARAKKDLLYYNPDFILCEFAVNDDNTEFFKETYEGVVRQLYSDSHNPALMLMCNVFYDDGRNAEDMHLEVAKNMDIPMVSMKSTIYPEIVKGNIIRADITPDNLHPNDAGHELVASVITYYLNKVYTGEIVNNRGNQKMPHAITMNAYENAIRCQNNNSSPVLEGFEADTRTEYSPWDFFRNGWTASKVGDKITFTVPGTELAIQYKRTIHKPSCVARAVIDGDVANAVILDGNFDQDWGDCLEITTLLNHAERGYRTLEIEIIDAPENVETPFYLISVITN